MNNTPSKTGIESSSQQQVDQILDPNSINVEVVMGGAGIDHRTANTSRRGVDVQSEIQSVEVVGFANADRGAKRLSDGTPYVDESGVLELSSKPASIKPNRSYLQAAQGKADLAAPKKEEVLKLVDPNVETQLSTSGGSNAEYIRVFLHFFWPVSDSLLSITLKTKPREKWIEMPFESTKIQTVERYGYIEHRVITFSCRRSNLMEYEVVFEAPGVLYGKRELQTLKGVLNVQLFAAHKNTYLVLNYFLAPTSFHPTPILSILLSSGFQRMSQFGSMELLSSDLVSSLSQHANCEALSDIAAEVLTVEVASNYPELFAAFIGLFEQKVSIYAHNAIVNLPGSFGGLLSVLPDRSHMNGIYSDLFKENYQQGYLRLFLKNYHSPECDLAWLRKLVEKVNFGKICANIALLNRSDMQCDANEFSEIIRDAKWNQQLLQCMQPIQAAAPDMHCLQLMWTGLFQRSGSFPLDIIRRQFVTTIATLPFHKLRAVALVHQEAAQNDRIPRQFQLVFIECFRQCFENFVMRTSVVCLNELRSFAFEDLHVFHIDEDWVVKLFHALFKRSDLASVALEYIFTTNLQLFVSNDRSIWFCVEWMIHQLKSINVKKKVVKFFQILITVVNWTMSKAMASNDRSIFHEKLVRDLINRCIKPLAPAIWLSALNDLYDVLHNVDDVIIACAIEVVSEVILAALEVSDRSLSESLKMEDYSAVLVYLQSNYDRADRKFASAAMTLFLESVCAHFTLPFKVEVIAYWVDLLCHLFKPDTLSNAVKQDIKKLISLSQFLSREVVLPIKDRMMTIAKFLDVQALSGDQWKVKVSQLFYVAEGNDDTGIGAMLQAIDEDIKDFRDKSKHLQCAFDDFNRASTPHPELADQITKLSEFQKISGSFTLQQLQDGSVWESFENFLQPAAAIFLVRRSKVFSRMLLKAIEISHDDLPFDSFFNEIVIATTAMFGNFLQNIDRLDTCDASVILAHWFGDVDVKQEVDALEDTPFAHHQECLMKWKDALDALREHQQVEAMIPLLNQAQHLLQLETSEDTVSPAELGDALKSFATQVRLNSTDEDDGSTTKTAVGLAEGILAWKKKVIYHLNRQDYYEIMHLVESVADAEFLVGFVKTIREESNFNLIDMIEEHADGYINADTVTDFDLIRRYLGSACAITLDDPFEWLAEFVKVAVRISSGKVTVLHFKLNACRLQANAIHDLWFSVAQREESTKRVVEKLLMTGNIFWCRVSNSPFMLVLTMGGGAYGGQVDKKERSFLEELRSRALLLVNSAPKFTDDEDQLCKDEESKRNMKVFINLVDMVLDITNTLNSLIDYGHFELNIPLIECKLSGDVLHAMSRLYKEKMKLWKAALDQCRFRFHCINFFFSTQLWMLFDYINGSSVVAMNNVCDTAKEMLEFLELDDYEKDEYFVADGLTLTEASRQHVKSLLAFLFDYLKPALNLHDTWLRMQACRHDEISECADVTSALQVVANALDEVLLGVDHLSRFVNNDAKNDDEHVITTQHVTYCAYESDSQLIPLLFGVFPDGEFSRAQVLVCEDGMTFEEFKIFLLRAFAYKSVASRTFAVLNFHVLGHSSRSAFFKAIAVSKALTITADNKMVLLARKDVEGIIAGVIRMVSVEVIMPLDDLQVQALFHSKAPNVTVVHAASAGVGKTEHCFQQAFRDGKRIVRLLITDQCSRKMFARQLGSIILSEHNAVLLDIAAPSAVNEIEFALFELLYLGVSQTGTQIVHWNVQSGCYIEEAINMYKSGCVNCLRYFPSVHVRGGPQNLIVNSIIESDIQVVCNYLQHLNNDTLHLQDLNFPCDHPNYGHRLVTMASIPDEHCRELLNQYFFSKFDAEHAPSINVFQAFLKVLAYQLRCFSNSGQYMVSSFQWSGGDPRNRTTTVQYLVDVAREFASRSVVSVRDRQRIYVAVVSPEEELDESTGVLRWEDNNQLMVSTSGGILTVLYKKTSDIPSQMNDWIINQTPGHTPPPDYFKLSSEMLREKLSSFCGSSTTYNGHPHYVLTPDNFLKITMALIRVQSGIPVIVMGEAGCGKTSLIRFAAAISNVEEPSVLAVHAGITRQDIESFIRGAIEVHIAKGEDRQPLWIFLDEINTCNDLGFINSIICDRFIPGIVIPRDVSFFAACNPYKRMRRQERANIIGLQSARSLHMTNNLVFRVKPLPDTMLDFVWDFGALSPADEVRYINAFMTDLTSLKPALRKLFSELVANSQQFIRNNFGNSAVSMRDVRRSKILIRWFQGHIAQTLSFYSYCKDYLPMILSLAHCYRCRLPNNLLRGEFDKSMVNVFEENSVYITDVKIKELISEEQKAYLRHMKNIGKGIAMNFSLRENVFVLLVCILTKIPVILIGKPGSSKSLSMSLIVSHLRGKDSQSEFFRALPEVKVISFQGSESSTSDGINKVFNKALEFLTKKDDSVEQKIIPLILLDEVGLAEISPHNPLKVLHSKLETPDDSELPYAIVGISNWSLDASKMSRMIQLSRPEPDEQELYDTALDIVAASCNSTVRAVPYLSQQLLRLLARNFGQFYNEQKRGRFSDFHGLRDFYSTCKFLGTVIANKRVIDPLDFVYAIRRNFGGLQIRLEETVFGTELKKTNQSSTNQLDVIDMIVANLKDELSRHLMIITEGDAFLSAMDVIMKRANVPLYRVIIGSKFKEDNSENYRYRILSEIILSMERGESLILRDLDAIHGSLYDMLNQNYTIINNKKNCRVALGAYSNPVASVHDSFKCIVVADSQRAYLYDPPFLNRHEKQYSRIFDLLNENERNIVQLVDQWVMSMCQVDGDRKDFTFRDTFVGYKKKDTVGSLVFSLSKEEPKPTTIDIKSLLMRMSSFQGVVRSLYSSQCTDASRTLCEEYLHDDRRINLLQYVSAVAARNASYRAVVTTYSKYYFLDVNDESMLPRHLSIQVEKLSNITSERQLNETISTFYRDENDKQLLIIQCDISINDDRQNLLLLKFEIERAATVYSNAAHSTITELAKIVIILLTVDTELYDEDRDNGYDCYYSSEWDHLHIDDLQQDAELYKEAVELVLGDVTFNTFLTENSELVKSIFIEDIMFYLGQIIYVASEETPRRLQDLANSIVKDQPLIDLICAKVVETMVTNNGMHLNNQWIYECACYREGLEFSSCSFVAALRNFVREKMRAPSAACLFLFEKYSAVGAYLNHDAIPQVHLTIFNKAILPTEEFKVTRKLHSFRFPFSVMIQEKLQKLQSLFTEERNKTEKRLEYVQRVKYELDEFFQRYGIDAAMLGNLEPDLRQDFLLYFFSANFSQLKIGVAVEAMQRYFFGSGAHEWSLEALLVAIWEDAKVLRLMTQLMIYDWNSFIEFSSNDRMTAFILDMGLHLAATFNYPSDHHEVLRYGNCILITDVCNRALAKLQDNLNMLGMSSWNLEMSRLILDIDELAKLIGLNYMMFNLDDEDGEYRKTIRLYADLMKHVLAVKVMLDLLNIITSLTQDNFEMAESIMDKHFRNMASLTISDDMIVAVFAALYEMHEISLGTTDAIAYSEFKILEKLLFVAVPREACCELNTNPDCNPLTDQQFSGKVTRRLFQSAFFEQGCGILSRYQNSPPLALSVMLASFLERITTIIANVEGDDIFSSLVDFESNCLTRSEEEESCEIDALRAFNTHFEIVDFRSSPLVVAMIDQMILLVSLEHDAFIESLPQLADCFSALLHRWAAIGYDNVSFLEQIYGLAFVKWFLKSVAVDPYVEDEMLIMVLADTIGRQNSNPLFHVCCLFFLKSLNKPYSELQLSCGPGGALSNKHPWLGNYRWEKIDNLLTTLRFAANDVDERVVDAWDTLFHPTAPSALPFEALIEGGESPVVELWQNLHQLAFLRHCRVSEAPVDSSFDRLADIIPAVDQDTIYIRHLTNLAFQRYHLPPSQVLPDAILGTDHSCLLAIVNALSFNCENGILQLYLQNNADVIGNSFVLAANSHELTLVYRALGASVGYFTCSCGFIYVIDNCQRPMENRACPQCSRPIGGHDHVFTVPNNAVIADVADPKGCYFQLELLGKVEHAERLMAPNEYRILSILIHCCFLHSLFTRPGSEEIQIAINQCWHFIKGHWNVLQQRLANDGNVERLGAFILEVAEQVKASDFGPNPVTVEQRQAAEQAFINICRPLLEHFGEEAARAVLKFSENVEHIAALEKELKELDKPLSFVSQYLRVTVPPSYKQMVMAFGDRREGERYPVLAAFFRFEDQLTRVCDMLPMVRWTNAVRRELSFRIDVHDAQRRVRDLLQDQNDATDVDFNLSVFKTFKDSWNSFLAASPVVTYNHNMMQEERNPDCHEIIPLTMNEDDNFISSCVRLDGKGREVIYMLHNLGEIQNAFLRDCLPHVPSLERGAQQRRLQEIVSEDIIMYNREELWAKLARYTRSSLAYGSGGRVECDWERIELKIVEMFVARKTFLQTNIWKARAVDEFRFKHEVFRKDETNLFVCISQIVPQDPALPRIDDMAVKNKAKVEYKLLPAVQALLNVLQYQVESPHFAEMTIMEFATSYLDRGMKQVFEEMIERNSGIPKLKLKYVEAFYELLEDAISDTVLGCLSERFNDPFDDSLKVKIAQFAEREVGGWIAFEQVWRRFMLRYLRGADQLDPNLPMSLYLSFIRWPQGISLESFEEKEETRDLFNAIQVRHCYQVWRFVDDFIAEMRCKDEDKDYFDYVFPDMSSTTEKLSTESAAAVSVAPAAKVKLGRKKKTMGLS